MKIKFFFTFLFFVSLFSIRAETPITNGFETSIEANPHCAAIFLDGNFHCTASLINEKWLVCAAHCFNTITTSNGSKSITPLPLGALQ